MKQRKFTNEEIKLIRAKLLIGVSPRFIVDELNKTEREIPVNKMDISNIKNNKYYKDVV